MWQLLSCYVIFFLLDFSRYQKPVIELKIMERTIMFYRSIMRLVIVCLVVTAALAAVLPEESAGYGGLDSLEAVRAQMQLKYKQLIHNPSLINETQPIDSKNLSSLKAYKSDLLGQYLKANHTDTADNIDNGKNNSIIGKGNEITAGDSNNITGHLNEVDGNENHIKGSQNVIHGSNNVILDKPINPSQIQIPSLPNMINPFLYTKGDAETNSTQIDGDSTHKSNNSTKSDNKTNEQSHLSQDKAEPTQSLSSNTDSLRPSDPNPTRIANNGQETLIVGLALLMLLMTIVY